MAALPSPLSPFSRSMLLTLLLLSAAVGCKSERKESADPSAERAAESAAAEQEPADEPIAGPAIVELDVEAILDQRLPLEESEQGWIRLFDGQSFFGWQITGKANWRVEEGAVVVDAGEPSFLATSIDWENYELKLEYQADAETNSGVFLRAPLRPEDPATDCYELNIAPPSNPFPTGSLVKRIQVEEEAIGDIAADQWHRYVIRVEGDSVQVQHDGKLVCDYTAPQPLPAGRISLQHNEGRVAFRDIRLRPLGLQSLLDEEAAAESKADTEEPAVDRLTQWKRYPEMPGEFVLNDSQQLHVTGGRGQLESRQAYGDFVLLTKCRTNADDLNSGIFFRCIPGEQMNGYECQISNEMVDGSPMRPADWGTGGFFKRSPARVIAAEDQQWFSMLLVAKGSSMAAWVNGIQVSDWQDRREPDANPRNGLRTEPGTLMLQAHDPTTDILFADFQVAAIGPLPEPAWPPPAADEGEKETPEE